MFIPLTRGFSAIIDLEDAPLVQGRKWYSLVLPNLVYAVTWNEGDPLYLHRLLIEAPAGTRVDHRDGNGLNNGRHNLRLCSVAQNGQNRGKPSNNSSGFKGVSWDKTRGKWRASIGVRGKQEQIGRYDSKEEAYAAYCAAALELHGEFANLGE